MDIKKIIGEFIISKFSKTEIETLKAEAAKFDIAPVAAPLVAPVAPAAPVVLKEAKTKDGKSISYDGELAAGTVVTVIDAATSAASPLPVGDYELEDGTKFTVTEAGKIAVVTPVVVAAPVQEPAVAGDMAKMSIQMSEQKATFETKLSAYEKESKDIKTELSELKASHGKLLTQFSKMLDTPVPLVTKNRIDDVDISQLKGIERHRALKEMNS